MASATRLALCSATAALALAGCGDDEAESGSSEETATTSTRAAKPPAKGVVATIEVELTEFELNPLNPGVQDAGKVAFEATNGGKVAHALEVEGPKGEVKTKEIAPGDTATFTADLGKPGKYKWYCPIGDHEQEGMTGHVFIAYDKIDQPDQPREDDGPGSDGHGGY